MDRGICRGVPGYPDKILSISGQFFLTGSQRFPLMKGVSESLAGRISIFDLSSLSADEIGGAGLDVEAFPQRGGFPELWATSGQSSQRFFEDYIATYLERDLRSLLMVDSLRTFDRFLRALALRAGGLLNLTELGREIGISGNTVRRWIDVLEASGVVALLEPWFGKEAKRLIKTPKLYFRDNGILCHLLRVFEPDAWRTHALCGQIWENCVFNEIRKALEVRGLGRCLWFWREKDGAEIDFVIEMSGRTMLVEAKISERPDGRGLWFSKFVSQNLHADADADADCGAATCLVACLQPEGRLIPRGEFGGFNPLLMSPVEVLGLSQRIC